MHLDRSVSRAALTTLLALALSACDVGQGEPAAVETLAPAIGTEPTTRVVRHDGVRVAVPSTWERLDTGDCLWRRARWAPPGAEPCRGYAGLAFFSSSLYDTLRGPGVYRDGDRGWSGYVIRDDVVVHVADPQRAVVRTALDSATAD